ncbi:MAG: hypothetical protein JWO12_465 [Frankiales bacterium]|nr:hypothetical protein [Frankiales bacterium]
MTANATYREAQRVPAWWFVAGLAIALGAAAEIDLGQPGLAWKVPYVVLPLLVLAGLLGLSRKRVLVEHGVVHVPGARAPVDAFGPPEVLDRSGLRLYLGPAARPDAWVVTSPWLKGAVLLPVVDPQDDTPYWLIGSRDPRALALALEARGGS